MFNFGSVSNQSSMYVKEDLEKVKLRRAKCQKWLKNQHHSKCTKLKFINPDKTILFSSRKAGIEN